MASEYLSIIKVLNILVITVPPDPDDSIIDSMQKKILAAMETHNTQGVILDIAGVDTMDSFFARTISDTAKMVRLLGGQTVVAGMNPSVAMTASQLGITLGLSETALNVERALYMYGITI